MMHDDIACSNVRAYMGAVAPQARAPAGAGAAARQHRPQKAAGPQRATAESIAKRMLGSPKQQVAGASKSKRCY